MKFASRLGRAFARQWMGALALVLVMGSGTAYAASVMWTGDNIVDSSLTGADVANDSLTGADIQSGSVTSSDLAPGATTSGGATAVVSYDEPGPKSLPLGSTSVVTWQQSTFTMIQPGFVEFFISGSATGPDATGCPGDDYTADGTFIIDGTSEHVVELEKYLNQGTSGMTAVVVSRYLGAGDHTFRVTGQMLRPCASVPGSVDFTDLHFLGVAVP